MNNGKKKRRKKKKREERKIRNESSNCTTQPNFVLRATIRFDCFTSTCVAFWHEWFYCILGLLTNSLSIPFWAWTVNDFALTFLRLACQEPAKRGLAQGTVSFFCSLVAACALACVHMYIYRHQNLTRICRILSCREHHLWPSPWTLCFWPSD